MNIHAGSVVRIGNIILTAHAGENPDTTVTFVSKGYCNVFCHLRSLRFLYNTYYKASKP